MSPKAVCNLGTPQTPYGRQGVKCTASGYSCIVASHFLFCPPCPYVFPTPLLLETALCLLLGVFSRAFFFFCSLSFCFLSRVRSFPSCGWSGVVSWLLFVAAASVFSFLLWFGGLVRFCFPFSCCCLCLRCLACGRLCGVGSSWCLFCLWLCLVCLRACRALVVFWGFVPLFFDDLAIA